MSATVSDILPPAQTTLSSTVVEASMMASPASGSSISQIAQQRKPSLTNATDTSPPTHTPSLFGYILYNLGNHYDPLFENMFQDTGELPVCPDTSSNSVDNSGASSYANHQQPHRKLE